MKRCVTSILVLAVALAVSACKKTEPPASSTPAVENLPPKQQAENLFKQLIPMTDALADSLEKAKDEDEAKAKAADYFKASMAMNDKLVALKLPDADRQDILEKVGPDLEKAQKRLMAAGKKYPTALAIAEDGPPHDDILPPGAIRPKPVYSWSGSLDAFPKTPSTDDGVITDAKTFAEAWAALKPGEKAPELDFAKVFALAGLSPAGFYRPVVYQVPGKDGDLEFSTHSGGQHVPGVRYFLVVYERQGVKTVNGKPLKK